MSTTLLLSGPHPVGWLFKSVLVNIVDSRKNQNGAMNEQIVAKYEISVFHGQEGIILLTSVHIRNCFYGLLVEGWTEIITLLWETNIF